MIRRALVLLLLTLLTRPALAETPMPDEAAAIEALLGQKGGAPKAFAQARAALGRGPLSATLVRVYVLAATRAKRASDARAWLVARAGPDGGPADIAYGLGALSWFEEDSDAAKKYLDIAIQLNPGHALALNTLARIVHERAAGRVAHLRSHIHGTLKSLS